MGWWGTGVMEGDLPMDVAAVMEDFALAGTPLETAEYGSVERVEAFARLIKDESVVARVLERCRTAGMVDDHYDSGVSMQAFGYVVMMNGGPIDSFRTDLLEAIDADVSNTWTSVQDRINVMTKFRQQVIAYDGTPIEDTTKGLFDVIAIRLAGE